MKRDRISGGLIASYANTSEPHLCVVLEDVLVAHARLSNEMVLEDLHLLVPNTSLI